MRFLNVLLGAATAATVLAAPAGQSATTRSAVQKRNSKFQFTGVSESGGEFGEGNIPGQLGKDYTWPAYASIDTMVAKGMNTFRVPTLMERITPSKLTGAFDEAYVAGLDDESACRTGHRSYEGLLGELTRDHHRGAYAIIDPHNYGRFSGQVITEVDDFKAWWTQVAMRYAKNEKVIFDTNNEYHDMDNVLVGQLNQAAIDGIRAAGATEQYIFVEGNSWTGAWHWVSSGTSTDMAKLTDPSDKIVYEMHQYLDSDGSGTATACVSSTIGRERLADATQWLKQNNKTGIIGETAGGANAQCIDALTDMLSFMEDNSDVWAGWLWWGGGPWWGDYMYSMEPPSGAAYTGVLPSLTQFI